MRLQNRFPTRIMLLPNVTEANQSNIHIFLEQFSKIFRKSNFKTDSKTNSYTIYHKNTVAAAWDKILHIPTPKGTFIILLTLVSVR